MLKKVITYVDLDGNEITEPFYFRLTKAELIEWDTEFEGGLVGVLTEISKSGNGAKILKVFKQIIMKTYGERHEDNKRFVKSPELSEAFTQTNAYDIFFMELVTDAVAAAAFVAGVLPEGFSEKLKEVQNLTIEDLQKMLEENNRLDAFVQKQVLK